MAPRPVIVLAKFELPASWNEKFAKAGFPAFVERTPEREEELSEKRTLRARELGRDPFEMRGRKRPGARIPDTGTPVFGHWGLQRVHVFDLFRAELQGFVLSKACLMRPGLVIEFARDKDALASFPWDLFERFTDGTFGQVDVWANERDPHKGVVHTVNCFGRSEKREDFLLRFEDGYWQAKPSE